MAEAVKRRGSASPSSRPRSSRGRREIVDGEFIVILGPSGCGKSTAAAHDRRPGADHRRRDRASAGGGQRAGAQGPRHRDGVPELRALPAHDGLRQHGLRPAHPGHVPRTRSRARARGGAASSGSELLQRKPRQLSGGQRQRVAMGRAHRARAAGVPVRRAAVEPRRQAARADAHRDQAAALRLAPPAST